MPHYSEVCGGEYGCLLGQGVPGLQRQSCNKLLFISRQFPFSRGIHPYMESSNQCVVLLFDRIMPRICLMFCSL